MVFSRGFSYNCALFIAAFLLPTSWLPTSANDVSLWVQPIETDSPVNTNMARLGWTVFNDPKLSSNHLVSCASCHDLSSNGAEASSVSTGVGGQGPRNSITVFNASLNYRFFWDGRANSLSEQIDGPIHNPLEMASSWPYIVEYMESSTQYQRLFEQLDLEINEEHIKQGLIAFMEALVTPNAPFDRYLNGNLFAIDDAAKRGWNLFQTVGCIQCHQGPNIGGSMIQKFGYFVPQPGDLDTGKHLVTNNSLDKFYFRVASLRNVAITPPYFHDGRTQRLQEAIDIMAKGQLGVSLPPDSVKDIEAFLKSLTAPRPYILEVFESE